MKQTNKEWRCATNHLTIRPVKIRPRAIYPTSDISYVTIYVCTSTILVGSVVGKCVHNMDNCYTQPRLNLSTVKPRQDDYKTEHILYNERKCTVLYGTAKTLCPWLAGLILCRGLSLGGKANTYTILATASV
jgi:hypothetical protein